MIEISMTSIQTWIKDEPIAFPTHDNPSTDPDLLLLFDAFSDQMDIGWDQSLSGRIAQSWFLAHDHCFADRQLHKSKNSTIIGPKMIVLLWKFGLNFWHL